VNVDCGLLESLQVHGRALELEISKEEEEDEGARCNFYTAWAAGCEGGSFGSAK
jgi:hypothetical protein